MKNKIIQDIIKENIDVIEANLQKKFQCADKEYMITGNKDRLNYLSDMLWYIRYLKVRKEFKYYGKRIYQSNFKLGKIKGAKTLWKS